MASITTTDLTKVLSELFPQKVASELIMRNRPFLGRINKDTGAGGRYVHVAMRYAPSAGVSHTFATAQANSGADKYAGFDVTVDRQLYGVFSISTLALRSYKQDKRALIRDIEGRGNAVFEALGNRISRELYGTGGGALATVGSTATTTLTLSNKEDVVNFYVGQVVESYSLEAGTGGSGGTIQRTITAVDDDAGTLTAATNWTTGGEFTNGWFIFTQGDRTLAMSGLRAWLPDTAPGATAFFGVDRSVDTVKLGGIRYVASASTDGSHANAVFNAASRASRQGGNPRLCLLHVADYAQLVREVEAKTTIMRAVDASGNEMPEVFYEGVKIQGPTGPITVISDPWCTKNRGYLIQEDTWTLWSLGDLIGWLDDDGKGSLLRQGSADALEGRVGGYYQLACDAPGFNVNLNLAATFAGVDT
jgi:hypothetical protein